MKTDDAPQVKGDSMTDARRMGKSELFSHFAERFEVKRTQAREFFDELTALAEKELKRVEAIINSMTLQERRNPAVLNGSRRRRIAQGSGTTVTDVNRLMKQFLEMKKMMQRVSKMGVRSLFSRMPNPFN